MSTSRSLPLRWLGFLLGLHAATSVAAAPLGLEVRAYPAGAIVAADWRLADTAALQWGLLAAYDFAQRGDAGRHEEEDGGGPGIGIYAQRPSRDRSWFWGGRLELFQLDIDWRDQGRRGSSDVTVLQPTATLGYHFAAIKQVDLSIAAHFGAEINLDTRGEAVGEGAIGLLGLRVGFGSSN